MAIVKVKQIHTTLKAAIEYIVDKKKTNHGILTSSNCGIPQIADSVYLGMNATWREARLIKTCGREGKVLAHHIIQSFLPGEIDAKKAHQLGTEFIEKILGGEDEYNYVIATHTDKNHVHNHIIFSPVNLKTLKRYRMGKTRVYEYRKISNQITKREGLSVSREWDGKNRTLLHSPSIGELYLNAKANSKKTHLSALIDYAIQTSYSFETFTQTLKQQGVEVCFKGGQILFNAPLLFSRPIRGKTLGISFSEHAIMNRLGRQNLTEFIIQKKLVTHTVDGKIRIQLPASRPPKFIYVNNYQLNDHHTHYRLFLPTTSEYQIVKRDGSLDSANKASIQDLSKYLTPITNRTQFKINQLGNLSVRGKTEKQKRYWALIDKKVNEVKNIGQEVNLLAQYEQVENKNQYITQLKNDLKTGQETLSNLIIKAQKNLDKEQPIKELNTQIIELASLIQAQKSVLKTIENKQHQAQEKGIRR